MPHPFAGAFQETGRVIERCPEEEADIDMRREGIDVGKGGIAHARRGMAIMQKLANVRAAAAHLFEPRQSEAPQSVIAVRKPSINAWVSPNGTGEAHERVHGAGGNGLWREQNTANCRLSERTHGVEARFHSDSKRYSSIFSIHTSGSSGLFSLKRRSKNAPIPRRLILFRSLS